MIQGQNFPYRGCPDDAEVCAVGQDSAPNFLKTLVHLIDHYGRLQIVWSIFLGLLAAIGVVVRMPAKPLTYLIAGAAFFGTWAVIGTSVFIVGKAIPMVKRWKYPHCLTTELAVGEKAELVLRHSGEPANWYVDAAIKQMLDKKERNPDPSPFQCVIYKGTAANTRMRMSDGEWGTITLASFQHSSWGRGEIWLSIFCNHNQRIRIPGSGVLLELTINSEPKANPIVRRYNIKAAKDGSITATPAA